MSTTPIDYSRAETFHFGSKAQINEQYNSNRSRNNTDKTPSSPQTAGLEKFPRSRSFFQITKVSPPNRFSTACTKTKALLPRTEKWVIDPTKDDFNKIWQLLKNAPEKKVLVCKYLPEDMGNPEQKRRVVFKWKSYPNTAYGIGVYEKGRILTNATLNTLYKRSYGSNLDKLTTSLKTTPADINNAVKNSGWQYDSYYPDFKQTFHDVLPLLSQAPSKDSVLIKEEVLAKDNLGWPAITRLKWSTPDQGGDMEGAKKLLESLWREIYGIPFNLQNTTATNINKALEENSKILLKKTQLERLSVPFTTTPPTDHMLSPTHSLSGTPQNIDKFINQPNKLEVNLHTSDSEKVEQFVNNPPSENSVLLAKSLPLDKQQIRFKWWQGSEPEFLRTASKKQLNQKKLAENALDVIRANANKKQITIDLNTDKFDKVLPFLYQTLSKDSMLVSRYWPGDENLPDDKRRVEFKWVNSNEKLPGYSKEIAQQALNTLWKNIEHIGSNLDDRLVDIHPLEKITPENIKNTIKENLKTLKENAETLQAMLAQREKRIGNDLAAVKKDLETRRQALEQEKKELRDQIGV